MASSAEGRRRRSGSGGADAVAVREGLREVLAQLEPLIKSSGSSANFAGMLAFLEETDDGFQHSQLVRWMRQQLEAALGTMVAEEVALQCRESELTPHKMKLVAPAILQKVLQSEEANELMSRMRAVISNTAWDMSKNLDSEYARISAMANLGFDASSGQFSNPDGGGGGGMWMYQGMVDGQRMDGGGGFGMEDANFPPSASSSSRPPFERTDSGNESLGSTWGNSNFMFLQPHQYARLGERLNKFTPPGDKIEALGTLLSTQLPDVVGSEAWPSISEGLQAAVSDQNVEVSTLALKAYTRLLGNITPFATKEAYVSLLASVTSVYGDMTRAHLLPTAASGLVFKKKLHFNLVQAIKLISEVTGDLPKYWSRYPEKYVDEIINAFVAFISLSPAGGVGSARGKSSQTPLLPIQLLALVDSKARWLRHWLHGNLGRSRLFKQLEATASAGLEDDAGGGGGRGIRRSFPDNLARYVLNTLENKSVDDWTITRTSFRSSARKKGNISESLINYGFFVNGVRIVCKVMQFERGVNLLSPSTCQQVLRAMVHFVSAVDHVSTRGPSRVISDCLATLATTKPSLWCSGGTESMPLLPKLLQPIRLWCKNAEMEEDLRQSQLSIGQLKTVMPLVLENVLLVLCPLLESGCTAARISSHRIGDTDEVATDLLTEFVTLAFERHQSFDCPFLLRVLALTNILVRRGSLAPVSANFPDMLHTLGEVYLELNDTAAAITPLSSTGGTLNEKQIEEVEQNKLLTSKLGSVLLSSLQTPKGLLAMVDSCDVVGYGEEEDILSKLAKSEISNLSEHEAFPLMALSKPGLMLLRESRFAERRLLAMLEIFTLEGDNQHWRPSPHESEVRMLRATTLFSSLASSLAFVKEAMTGGSNGEYVSLRGLLHFDETPFPNYSESESVFALKILSCLLSSLDHLVYLQANFGLVDKLRKELECESHLSSDGVIIVDRETLYLHFICRAADDIGAPTERDLPTLSFEERKSWKLDLANTGLVAEKVRLRSDCPLSSFLDKTRGMQHDPAWLDGAKKHFRTSVQSGFPLRGATLLDLLEQATSTFCLLQDQQDLLVDRAEKSAQQFNSSGDVTSEESRAIAYLKEYARYRMGVDLDATDFADFVIKRGMRNSSESREFHGFDWFLGVVFLLLEGDLPDADRYLDKISGHASSAFLWPDRRIASALAPLLHIGHHVEVVLSQEAGLVYATLQSEGISVPLVTRHWLSQCFLNVLHLESLTHAVGLVSLFGPEYLVYICVVLFEMLQSRMVSASSNQLENDRYLIETIMAPRIEGLAIGDNMARMEQLSEKYGSVIRRDLKAVAAAALE